MMPWLSIIGIGANGIESVTPSARSFIDKAELLVGGTRHLDMLPTKEEQTRLPWCSPLVDTLPILEKWRGRAICILASGDPFCYGIGTLLVTRFAAIEEMIVIPTPSAFSLACARLGWSFEDVEILSVHGRPLGMIQPFLQPRNRLLVLAADRHTPGAIASLLCCHGLGNSRLIILEHLGGTNEKCYEARAHSWSLDAQMIDPFHTLAIICLSETSKTMSLARIPGLPEEAFDHDGTITKREIRSATLAALIPGPDQLLWDVGAGCGSVAIEWLRCDRRCRAIAIESDSKRLSLIASNADALGCSDLVLIEGQAPTCLHGLPTPDAIFIGGGLSQTTDSRLLEVCWQALRSGGRLVANAVTLQAEQKLLNWFERYEGKLVRLQITRAQPIGGVIGWKPLMPVTQYIGIKP